LNEYVDEILSSSGKVAGMGLGGKQLDFMCNMDAPHPSFGDV
jgi:hypothetical protein